MKIYTSEIAQHGRKLKIANEIVEFDNTGCAEVNEEVAEKITNYSEWYSKERPKMKIEPKKATFEDVVKEQHTEALQLEVKKLQKMNESRKEKADMLSKEINDVRSSMEDVTKERDTAKKRIEEIEEVHKKEVEDLQYKFELAMMEADELKATCEKMGMKEEEYIKKKSKKALIELILKK